ncbi:hypothetical protein O1L60_14150 [Streptomyces diastatochromogenes]|nr:hypothetical protein [Streptomyces diastatochromogenes]
MVRAGAARTYRDRGWREDADAAALDAVALSATDPEKAEALALLGDLAWERGEPAEALGRYGEALRLVRDHGPSLAGRARSSPPSAAPTRPCATGGPPWPGCRCRSTSWRPASCTSRWAGTRRRRPCTGVCARPSVRPRRSLSVSSTPTTATRPPRSSACGRSGPAATAPSRSRTRSPGRCTARRLQGGPALREARHRRGSPQRPFLYHRGAIERALNQTGPARRHLEESLRVNPGSPCSTRPGRRRAWRRWGAVGRTAAGAARGAVRGASGARGVSPGPSPCGPGRRASLTRPVWAIVPLGGTGGHTGRRP